MLTSTQTNNNANNTHDSICIFEYYDIIQRLLKQKAIKTHHIQLPNQHEFTLQTLYQTMDLIFNTPHHQANCSQHHKCTTHHHYDNSNSSDDNNSGDDEDDDVYCDTNHYNIMNFAQVIFFKTLPCPKGDTCANKPREIAPSNQYKDCELKCPYYHHDKDKRRLSVTKNVEEEFIYKANYDKTKCDPSPDKYSLNYFESIFHPIYYKLFECKRIHCQNWLVCPFYHVQYEKLTWDQIFYNFIKKTREIYTKEKKNKPKTNSATTTTTNTIPLTNNNSSSNSKNNKLNDESINVKSEIKMMNPKKNLTLATNTASKSTKAQVKSKKNSIELLNNISSSSFTSTSTSSSASSSINEFSPKKTENLIFEDFPTNQVQNMPCYQPQLFNQPLNANFQQNYYQHQSPKTQQNLLPPGLNTYPQNKTFVNPESIIPGYSLFGDYSDIVVFNSKTSKNINTKQANRNHHEINNGGMKNNYPREPLGLNQFFNWQVIQNISNLSLHH